MADVKPIYIVADDLTGSADAASYFRTQTRQVRVSLREDEPWNFLYTSNVVQVFDAESRGVTLEVARQRMAHVGKQLAARGEAFSLYKKVDSTLRGQIGAEIEGLLQGVGRNVAVLAPSFPAAGRTVERGILYVNQTPISQTPISRDPHTPVTIDSVADIVRQTTSLPVVELAHGTVNKGSHAISQFLSQLPSHSLIVVADATTDSDLQAIAQAVAERSNMFPCGSAGLAKQLAFLWSGQSLTNANEIPDVMASKVKRCDRVVIAVGSANPNSHEQLEEVLMQLSATRVTLDPVRLAVPETHDEELHRAMNAIPDAGYVAIDLARQRATRSERVPGTFDSDLGSVVKVWADTQVSSGTANLGFVATGGDTALAICLALGAHSIWPQGEVMPGMPWSWMETEMGIFPLISKAGGFGNKYALMEAANFLTNGTT